MRVPKKARKVNIIVTDAKTKEIIVDEKDVETVILGLLKKEPGKNDDYASLIFNLGYGDFVVGLLKAVTDEISKVYADDIIKIAALMNKGKGVN